MKKSDLFQPQRQSIFAIILILLKFGRMLIRQLWPLLLVFFFKRGSPFEYWFGIVLIAAGGLSLIGSVVEYFKFYYYIENGQLHIDRGILRRVSIDIPFERIQTVDFEQNVVHQLFNVVRVNIDSAGTKGNEASFDALTKEQAVELRDYILAQKAEITGESEMVDDENDSHELILELSSTDLLKIGASQNHLRTAGIIFAAMWALVDNIGQAINPDIYDTIGEEAETLVNGSIVLVLIAIPLFLIFSFVLTLIRTVFRYYDLKFFKTDRGFKLLSGLLTRKEKSAQRNKIQIVSWSTNPIRRLFKMYVLNLYQASSVEVIGGKAMSVPGVYKHHIESTLRSVMPRSLEAQFETHGIHPLARFRFVLFAGLLPCAVFSVIALLTKNYSLFYAWLYFPLSVYMGYLYHKKRKLELNPDFLISQSGIFTTRNRILEIYKIQSVKVSQSFYQWRKDLATVTVYTASGDMKMPFIPIEKARQIADYILYRVESDKRRWM